MKMCSDNPDVCAWFTDVVVANVVREVGENLLVTGKSASSKSRGQEASRLLGPFDPAQPDYLKHFWDRAFDDLEERVPSLVAVLLGASARPGTGARIAERKSRMKRRGTLGIISRSDKQWWGALVPWRRSPGRGSTWWQV